MLIVGQKTAKYYASSIATTGDYIQYASVGKEFKFMLVSERKNYDLSNKIGKATRTFVIRTDAKIDFKENDKIVWNERDYIISDVTEEDSKMTTLLVNKSITMVG